LDVDELAQTRLIVAAVVGAIVGAFLLSRHFDNRREQGFAALAQSLGAPIAESLAQIYTAEIPPESLDLEEGKLIQRSRTLPGAHDGPRLRDLLTRQGALAAQLERSL
jgi:hypothetical protein